MNDNKVTSSQSLNFGGQVAGILHELEADKGETQLAIESRSHPVWAKITSVIQECLVKVEEVKVTIIEWLSDLTIPAQKEFTVVEHFTKANPDVKFWDFGGNFMSWFRPLVENEVGETTARIGKLRVPAKIAEMTPELGERRIMTLSQLYWMLSQQPKGEKPNGKNRRLLTNGYANLLRVLDKDGIERSVYAGWSDGSGWYVCARGLEDELRWYAGYQVVSSK